MSTGKKLRIVGDVINTMFKTDKYGSLIASKDHLQVDRVAQEMYSQLEKDPGLARRLVERTYNTDVEFATRPYGSTPVIAHGVPLFGPAPRKGWKFSGELPSSIQLDKEFVARSSKRERKITHWVKGAWNLTKDLPTNSEKEELLKEIELDQVLTGGGYDGTEAYSITKSALDFLNKSADEISFMDSELSEILMEQILKFRERFWKQLKVRKGSLRIKGIDVVRMLQDTDGMMGWPVYTKARIPLTKTTALRILDNTNVDVRHLVGQTVKDPETGEEHLAYVVDAVAFAMDNMTVSADNLPAIITTLARIQRHGYTANSEGDLEEKPGKSRSVSPNSAVAGAQEAMSFQSILDIAKDSEVPWLPSLQDHPTQVRLIKDWYEKELVPKEMRALMADWSGYDKTLNGDVLATIIYYIIRPMYHVDDQAWIDLAIVSLTYKYFIVPVVAAEASPELWGEVLSKLPHARVNEDFYIVGTKNGLPSGAKITHVGGSLYGELIIHHCIPAMLGYEGIDGPQAGDDTLMAYPIDRIDPSSAEKTYKPIQEAAAKWGLDMNLSKQVWVVSQSGEPSGIFLQYSYHYDCDIWGIGTGARYHVAAPFAERDKGLTIPEQYMAVISKYNNGYNSPFIKFYLKAWFEDDDYISALFKEYGVSAFTMLVESIGGTLQEITQRLDLTYNWGLSTDDLLNGRIPVLPIMAEVAQGMSPRVSAAHVLESMAIDATNQHYHDDITNEPDDTFDDESDADLD